MDVQTSPQVDKFVKSLQKATRAKVVRELELLNQFGHLLGPPHSKRISVRLSELRIRGQQEVRIFYTIKNENAYLLSGFVKKSQKTPDRELKKAENLLANV